MTWVLHFTDAHECMFSYTHMYIAPKNISEPTLAFGKFSEGLLRPTENWALNLPILLKFLVKRTVVDFT